MGNEMPHRSRDTNGISRTDVAGAMQRVLDAAGSEHDTKKMNHPETLVEGTKFTEGLFMRVIILSRFRDEGIHAEKGDCNAALRELYKNFDGKEIKGYEAFWGQDGKVVLYTDRQGRVKIGKICAAHLIGPRAEDIVFINDMQIPGERSPVASRLDKSDLKLSGKIIPESTLPKNTQFSAIPRDAEPKRKTGVSIMVG